MMNKPKFVQVTEAGMYLSKATRQIINERGRKIDIEVLHYNNGQALVRMAGPDSVSQNFITEAEAFALSDCLVEALVRS